MMADYREGLRLLPDHMWGACKAWIERGEPHPLSMGSFFHSILVNDFVSASINADAMNAAAFFSWAQFLHTYVPAQAWGSEERLIEWYSMKHLKQ